MAKHTHVVVVGAGPVGLLTALGLAQQGLSVTVIDAEPGINDSPRAAVYFPTTIKILDRLGLLEETRAIGYLSKSFCFHLLAMHAMARIANTFPADSPYPYNVHLGQHLLAELVLKHFSALPDAVMRWRTRVVGLHQDESGATLTVETPQRREQIRAQWVVAADGARSTVRNLLSLSFDGHTWPERFVATNVEYDFEHYGYEPANMIADAVNWAVVARLGRENIWQQAVVGAAPDAWAVGEVPHRAD